MSTCCPDLVDAALLRGRSILILDDELLVAIETKACAWQAGATVIGPYARVHAALEAIQLHRIDGAILDVNIAGVHSFPVADSLASRGVPFVFCTGYGRDVIPPRFRHVAVVGKPVIPEMLIAALAGAMKARNSQAER